MNKMETYAAPRILQTQQVQLEEDFLAGASNMSLIWINGHEIGEEIDSNDPWTLD